MEKLILKYVISIFAFYIGYFTAEYLDCWIEKRKSIKKANYEKKLIKNTMSYLQIKNVKLKNKNK